MMTVMVDDGRRGWCWTSDFNERAVVARQPHVLARRAHKTEGPVGQAPSCARASLTQDSLVPGLGGWSDRRTRAVGGSLAATPSNQIRGGWSAGYPLLFRLQRVMTRAVKASPAIPYC